MGTATDFAPKPISSTVSRDLGARIKAFLNAWVQRMQQRQQLAAMSTYELRDIGLTHADVYREMQKAPWQR